MSMNDLERIGKFTLKHGKLLRERQDLIDFMEDAKNALLVANNALENTEIVDANSIPDYPSYREVREALSKMKKLDKKIAEIEYCVPELKR